MALGLRSPATEADAAGPIDTSPSGSPRPTKSKSSGGLTGYARLFFRLVADSVWRFKGTVVLMIGSGLGALAMQVGAIGVAIGYAQQLQNDETITFRGTEYVVRDSVEVLAVAAVGAGLLLMGSAVLNYLSFRWMVKLRQDYEAFSASRALARLGAASQIQFEHPDLGDDDKSITGIVRRDARFCGRTLGILSKLLMPLVTLLLAAAALAFLALFPTLIVAVIALASTPWVIRVNRQAAQSSRDLEVRNSEASQEYSRVVKWLSRSPYPLENPAGLGDSILGTESVKRLEDAYGRRLMATEKAGLVSGVASAAALIVLVVTLGTAAIRSGAGLTTLLAYLMIMGRAIASFRTVNRSLSGVNRFYPQVKRYFAFLDATEPGSDGAAIPRAEVVVRTLPEHLAGSAGQQEISGPTRIALVASFPVTRYTLPRLVRLMVWDDRGVAADVTAAATFATGAYEYLPELPMRDTLGIPPDLEAADVCRELDAVGIATDDVDWAGLLDKPVAREHWIAIRDEAKLVFAVMNARRSNAHWVFVDEKSLKRLDAPGRAALLEGLDDRGVVIVHDPVSNRVGVYGEQHVVIVNDEGVVGVGEPSWFNDQVTTADLVATGVADPEKVAVGALYDDSDDDLDLDE